MRIYNKLSDIVGNIPMFELNKFKKINSLETNLYAKLEFLNPMGSIKDRVAVGMIVDAQKKGILKPGGTIIEPTSGNTGIALAAIGNSIGYRVIIVMPDNMSLERRKLLKAYGAEIVLTDASSGMQGAILKAEELKKSIVGSIIMGQFTNFINPETHEKNTGPEIWDDMDGKIDIFISAVGTGGTITGVGRFLKNKNPKIKVVAVEPSGSPFLSQGISGPHGIQGIGAGFIPDILDTNVYDEIIAVTDEDAFQTCRQISKSESLFVGISSGAIAYAAIQISKRMDYKGKNIVIIFPDSGERYLSTKDFL